MSLESYDILGLDYDASLPEIRTAFKKLALFTHPDKPTGNTRLFDLVKRAYTDILYAYEARQNAGHDKLREQSQVSIMEQQSDISAPILDPKKFNREQFNKVFVQHRVDDPNDHGYDLSKDTSVHASQYDNCMIQYIEPETIYSNGQFSTLGQGHVSDYTAPFNAKVKYTDCMRSMATPLKESELLQGANVNRNEKTVIRERSTMAFDPSTTDTREYNRIQQDRLDLERNRQRQHAEQDNKGINRGIQMRRSLGYK